MIQATALLISIDYFDAATAWINVSWTAPNAPAPWNTGSHPAGFTVVQPFANGLDLQNKIAAGLSAWLTANAGFTPTVLLAGPTGPAFRKVVATPDTLDPAVDRELSVDTSAVGGPVNVDLSDAGLIVRGTSFLVKNEDGDFDVTLTPFGSQEIDEVPGVFSLASIAALPAKVCVTLIADQTTIEAPTTPAPPAPFVGVVRAVPGAFATVALAIAAAAPGDVIEIAAGSTITEAGTVMIDKSLEIRGVNRATSVVEGPAALTAALLQVAVGVTDVYIHTLTVRNNQLPSADGGGQSACIAVPTQRAATPSGSVGVYIDNCDIVHPKIGISIDADGWVIRDCAFVCNVAASATTVRPISNYGTANNCFIADCTFTCTTDVTPRTAMINIFGVGPRDVSFFTGQSGALVIRNCVQVGTCRGYIEQNYWKQPGDALDPVVAGGFSLYIEGCTFGAYSSFPVSFFNTVGAAIDPLDFYDRLWLSNNTTGARTSGDQKGFVGFDGDGGPGRDIGAPASGLYAPVANVIGSDLPSATYDDGSTVDDLLGVKTSIFAVPAPLLAPTDAVVGAWRFGPSFG
jgi:hypothetical protein